MTQAVRCEDGKTRTATYRSAYTGNAGFIRINGVTVSGRIHYESPKGYYFKARGLNKSLVQ